MHSQANSYLHRNKLSRESIFCGEVEDWLAERALIMLNFLLKTRQRRLCCLQRAQENDTENTYACCRQRVRLQGCCSWPTEAASRKSRSYLPLTTSFPTCREMRGMTSARSHFESQPRFVTNKWGRISDFIVSLPSNTWVGRLSWFYSTTANSKISFKNHSPNIFVKTKPCIGEPIMNQGIRALNLQSYG